MYNDVADKGGLLNIDLVLQKMIAKNKLITVFSYETRKKIRQIVRLQNPYPSPADLLSLKDDKFKYLMFKQSPTYQFLMFIAKLNFQDIYIKEKKEK